MNSCLECIFPVRDEAVHCIECPGGCRVILDELGEEVNDDPCSRFRSRENEAHNYQIYQADREAWINVL
jgi:hypothetical protein